MCFLTMSLVSGGATAGSEEQVPDKTTGVEVAVLGRFLVCLSLLATQSLILQGAARRVLQGVAEMGDRSAAAGGAAMPNGHIDFEEVREEPEREERGWQGGAGGKDGSGDNSGGNHKTTNEETDPQICLHPLPENQINLNDGFEHWRFGRPTPSARRGSRAFGEGCLEPLQEDERGAGEMSSTSPYRPPAGG